MKIGYLFVPDLLGTRPTDRLVDAARQMAAAGVGALAVLDGDRLVAIITERDLARAVADGVDAAATEVAAYASHDVCVATVDEDSTAVGRRMLDAGIRHLPVLEDSRLVGMISMRDLLAVHTWA